LSVVLALESSCDETAAAVLRAPADLLATEIATQADLHRPYGGIVPEVASRHHLRKLQPVIERVLDHAGLTLPEIDVFAATSGPGLATSLMVGVAAAKGLALGHHKPYVAVNHLEGHLLSPFFHARDTAPHNGSSNPPLATRDVPGVVEPAIGLVVSGGHTLLVEIQRPGSYRLLGRTRDDAAGEAFDKVGKLLGLDYPAGPEIDRLAREGRADRFTFPRSMLQSGDHDFSFSGLKTSVRYLLPKLAPADLADVCASFQEAVVDVLVSKTLAATRATGLRTVAVSGGVSCNTRLRARFAEACAAAGLSLRLAEPRLYTDNAAMIAFVAAQRAAAGRFSALTDDIDPNLGLQTENRK
jgi:N6-L-threonylcarbamoyladenine synthase